MVTVDPAREAGVSRRRLLTVAGVTAFGIGALLAYPTSTGPGSSRSVVATGAATSVGTATASSGAATTYTGGTVQTQWGPVQVAITVSGGRITAAQTVQVPSGNQRDQEINSYAVPVLNGEVVQKQSAKIDTVSGATVTSDGYLQSLQSAIDAAHLP